MLDFIAGFQGRITIVSHLHPDGDTIGSSLAIYLWLKSLGKEPVLFCCEEVPTTYRYLPGVEYYTGTLPAETDLFIAVDCADMGRMGSLAMNAFQKTAHTVCIDHHQTNDGYAEYNHVEPHAGSTGEVIACLFKEAGITPTQNMADALYNAIVADTGQFAFGGTTTKSLQMAAWLLENGARLEYINNQLFRIRTYSRTLLMGHALTALQMLDEGKIGLISIAQNVLDQCGATFADAENLVNFAVEVDTAMVGVLLMETGEYRYKCSLRSSGKVNVAEIAASFNGGGHKMAAGCTLYGTEEQTLKALLQKLREAINSL